jgi:hypothetical protein
LNASGIDLDMESGRFRGVNRSRELPGSESNDQRIGSTAAVQNGVWGATEQKTGIRVSTGQNSVQNSVFFPPRRDAPVLPANLETFVKAIELLAEQRSCEVGLIGLGRGDSSFGPHTLASFPTHDPRKGKRIAWAWIKREKRPRRVAIAEVGLENKFAYALEIERTNQEHSILVLAREDSCQTNRE